MLRKVINDIYLGDIIMDNEQIKTLRQFTDNDLSQLKELKKMCSFSELK